MIKETQEKTVAQKIAEASNKSDQSKIILIEETKSLGVVQELEGSLPEIVPEIKGIRPIFTKEDRKALASLENM